jgi:tol-pal system protein YbgF
VRATLPRSALALAVVGLVACAPTARDLEQRQLRERLDTMQARLTKQERQLSELSNQLFLLSDKAAQNRAPATTAPATPPAPAMPALQVVRLSAPRPPPEEPAVDYVLVDDEPGHLAVANVPPPPARPASEDATAEQQFREALTAYQQGHADRASELFSRLLQQYPNHAHADAALYWLGESRYEAQAYADAIRHFLRLLDRYPRSSKRPDALLKLGLAYERSGQADKSRLTLEELVRTYPDSALGELAKSRLAGVSSGG